MAEILISSKDLSRNEWLEYRKTGIGGSDASIICGINKYKSQVQLWMEKTNEIEQSESGEAAYWGTKMEPIIREEFTIRTNLKVDIVNSILRHEKYDFMLANLDGIIYDPEIGNCIFEAKTASAFKQSQWEDSIPEEYMLQIQHYMSVTGFKGTYIAALIGGNQFVYHFIKRDEELIDMIIKLEKDFWYHVVNKIPPELDGSEASKELLNRLYHDSNENSQIILHNEAEKLLTQYDIAKEKEKEISEMKAEAVNKLKAILGENETGISNNRTVTWKSICSQKFDSKKLKKDLPEIYEKYVIISNYRRFTIK